MRSPDCARRDAKRSAPAKRQATLRRLFWRYAKITRTAPPQVIALARQRTAPTHFSGRHMQSRGTERSHFRRQTSFAPSQARKPPCSWNSLRVHDSRISVSMRICHASRDIVWVRRNSRSLWRRSISAGNRRSTSGPRRPCGSPQRSDMAPLCVRRTNHGKLGGSRRRLWLRY